MKDDLTDELLDADGDGRVTPADILALRNRGVPASSIEAALEKMQARLTSPEQTEAMQQLRSAIEPPQGAMQLQGGFGWALALGLVGALWMRRTRAPARPVERAVDAENVRAARLTRLSATSAPAPAPAPAPEPAPEPAVPSPASAPPAVPVPDSTAAAATSTAAAAASTAAAAASKRPAINPITGRPFGEHPKGATKGATSASSEAGAATAGAASASAAAAAASPKATAPATPTPAPTPTPTPTPAPTSRPCDRGQALGMQGKK